MSWLKEMFCRHKFVFVRNVYGDEIIELGWKRSLWKCSICGKVTARDELGEAKP